MRVLVGCEFSATVGRAFHDRGHDVLTVDLLPTEDSTVPHYQGDLRDVLDDGWDLGIFHPPCTRLANSGVRWLHERNLWADLDAATDLFRLCLNAPIPRVAVENPVPHKYALERIGRKYDQTIQPWQFGHGETKRTCLWLRGLPLLTQTDVVAGRKQRVWRMAPSPERAKERSRFFPGIAAAMATQWGFLQPDTFQAKEVA